MALGKNVAPASESFARIDFHAHILPELDHGSRSTSDSLAQMELLVKAGVDTVCATSHFYPHSDELSDFLERRERSFRLLEDARADAPRPKMILGAEVLICEGMEDMEGLERLCFEGTDLLLLELPLGMTSLNQSLYETVIAIRDKGITPVLAHVDRYPARCIDPLIKAGISAQLNAVSLLGLFKAKHLEKWIGEGCIVGIGSDYHFGYEDNLDGYCKLCDKRADIVKLIFDKSAKLLDSAIKR